MKKIITVFSIFTIILAGCGKVNEQETVKYSDIFNDGKESISYVVKNSSDDSASLGKDSEIVKYIVSKDNKIAVYNDDMSEDSSNTTLGKIIKMKDNEKIDYIKNRDKESFSKVQTETLNNYKSNIEDDETVLDRNGDNNNESDDMTSNEKIKKHLNLYKKIAKKVENTKYKEPSFEKLTIEASTDETGNSTEKEFINLAGHDFDEDSKNGIYRDSKEAANPDIYGSYFTNVVSPMELYDTKIAGLSDIDYTEEDNGYSEPAYEDYRYLVTEVGDKTEKFELDQPDDDSVKEK
ncbi:hypothetical protein [Mammaliicoccus sp. Dog046]|uniref:hypothetical protein n=1 Tax=Mammaliicoccus sp. Dog046 TaxID=3034233 RepID=UPI002B262B10|nr:hypothetical protein [Mammaliicoccus sp. Dog046]WQK85220.1 hypothetical protein P3U32_11395 [Mammaliicoccus sp. Dog046]